MTRRRTSRAPLIAVTLVIGTVLAYLPTFDAGFLNYDDPLYVTENARVMEGLTPDGVLWAFRMDSFVAGNWHPLTVISHMADVELFDLAPAGHHASSLALHAACVIALFLVLYRVTGGLWRSAIVAALFAVHPVQVESVAWVAERKNVLSTLFWLLGIGAYLRYVARPGHARMTLVATMLALGLLAKPMLVTFPFTLLLLDVWPLRRWQAVGVRRLVLEKLPLFVLVALGALATLYAQAGSGAVSGFDDEPLGYRLANAVVSYGDYLVHLAWPMQLSPFYPLPPAAPSPLLVGAVLVALLGVTFVAVRKVRSWPWLLIGWLWYAGVLVPVIGIVQVGNQAMADRYLHVPAIGIFIVVVWGFAAAIGWETRRRAARVVVACATALILLGFGRATHTLAQRWQDSETLFRYAAALSDCNYFAHNNLGTALEARGAREEALAEFRQAVHCLPQDPVSRMNLGTICLHLGRLDEAETNLRVAVELDPSFAAAHANLGATLMKRRRFDEAIDHLRTALRLDGDLQAARNNLARAQEWQRRGN